MATSISILDDPRFPLERYQSVPISFRVREIYAPVPPGPSCIGIPLALRQVNTPYVKEYDHPGNQPVDWPATFDIANWGIMTAHDAGQLVGGAAVAWNTPAVNMLEGRPDLAVLWDLRVAVASRGRGVGRALFAAARDWCRARKVTELKIETQNINVPACRFYAAQGSVLTAINCRAYPELPNEIQLIWMCPVGG